MKKTVRHAALILAGALAAGPAAAGQHRSPAGNFLVSAKDPEVARQVGEYAEHYRRTKALEWLGQEMPPWQQPCTIQVKVTHGGAGGATSFAFDRGQILSQQMTVEGSLERILNSVLPHEITHTVFAARFRRPLPRWADEGGAVLSEDYQELARHDLLVRQLINQGRMIPLRRLFVLTEYPRDVMALYAQGFSIANFLVSMKGKHQYLDFVEDGQSYGWEFAIQRHFRYSTAEELEDAWIAWLRAGRGTGADGPPTLAGTQWNVPGGRVLRAQGPEETALASRSPASSSAVAARAPEPYGEPTRIPAVAARGAEPPPSRPGASSSALRGPSDPFEEPSLARSGSAGARYAEENSFGKVVAGREPLAWARNHEGNPPVPSADAKPRRLIPIAVGRTQRRHGPTPSASSSSKAPLPSPHRWQD